MVVWFGHERNYLDTALGLRFEVHIRDHVREQQTSDAIPSPALDPPRRNNEEESALDSPASSGIRDDDHGHVNSEADLCVSTMLWQVSISRLRLHINHVNDPKHLPRKCIAPALLAIFLRDPE